MLRSGVKGKLADEKVILTLTLTLSPTLILNHLANEALLTAIAQYGLMYLTYGCAMNYKQLLPARRIINSY